MNAELKAIQSIMNEGLEIAANERKQIIAGTQAVADNLAAHAKEEMETVRLINNRIAAIDQRQEQFSTQLLEINTSLGSLIKWQEKEEVLRRERQIKQDARDELFAELAQADVDAKLAQAEAEDRRRKSFVFYARMGLTLAGMVSLLIGGETIYSKIQWSLKLIGFE